ncbi:MAG: J domain-containing protein [Cyanobacteria bacterium J06555_13]
MTASASASPQQTYYDLLSLRPNASVQDIRRAYRDLSKLYHPDTTELDSAIATVKFQALNEAYATLSSPEKRIAYDYQIGYSRLSVLKPLEGNAPRASSSRDKPYDPTASAYLDPTDRPLSAGELFALFILGITFIACLILVFTIGLTKSELSTTQGATHPTAVIQSEVIQSEVIQPDISSQPNSSPSPDIPSPLLVR